MSLFQGLFQGAPAQAPTSSLFTSGSSFFQALPPPVTTAQPPAAATSSKQDEKEKGKGKHSKKSLPAAATEPAPTKVQTKKSKNDSGKGGAEVVPAVAKAAGGKQQKGDVAGAQKKRNQQQQDKNQEQSKKLQKVGKGADIKAAKQQQSDHAAGKQNKQQPPASDSKAGKAPKQKGKKQPKQPEPEPESDEELDDEPMSGSQEDFSDGDDDDAFSVDSAEEEADRREAAGYDAFDGLSSDGEDQDEDEGDAEEAAGPSSRRRRPVDVDSEEEEERERQEERQKKKAKLQVQDSALSEEEAAKLRRTVFVGNLPAKVEAREVKRFFKKYGSVESVRLRSVPLDFAKKKKMPRKAAIITGAVSEEHGAAHAYVVFKEESSVEGALAANMTVLSGNHIRVDKATRPSLGTDGEVRSAGVQYDPKRSVFVGNLPFMVKDEELIQLFTGDDAAPELENALEAVRVVRDKATNIGKGFAFVLFKTKAAARAALDLENPQVRGRAVRITRMSAKSSGKGVSVKPSKGAKPSPGRVVGRKGNVGDKSKVQEWQGLQTKGKAKPGFRGAKPGAKPAGAAGGKGAKGGSGSGQRASKRPSVAARKAKQLAELKTKKKSQSK